MSNRKSRTRRRRNHTTAHAARDALVSRIDNNVAQLSDTLGKMRTMVEAAGVGERSDKDDEKKDENEPSNEVPSSGDETGDGETRVTLRLDHILKQLRRDPSSHEMTAYDESTDEDEFALELLKKLSRDEVDANIDTGLPGTPMLPADYYIDFDDIPLSEELKDIESAIAMMEAKIKRDGSTEYDEKLLVELNERREVLNKRRRAMYRYIYGTPKPEQNYLTPLAVACVEGRLGDIRKIIKHVPLDPVDVDGRSPIFLACSIGNADIVKELLGHGADLSIADMAGRTPVEIVCAKRDHGVTQVILGYIQGRALLASYLVDMCKKNKTAPIRFLLDCGLDVDCVDGDGDRPLCAACREQHAGVIALLLERGSTLGLECLDNALTECLVLAARVLMDGGVDPSELPPGP